MAYNQSRTIFDVLKWCACGAQAMAVFVAAGMAPKQALAPVSRGVPSTARARPAGGVPPSSDILADIQSVVASVLGASIAADQPFMQVRFCCNTNHKNSMLPMTGSLKSSLGMLFHLMVEAAVF